MIILVLGTYFINNYNSFKMYIFQASGDKFVIRGSATFTREKNILNISSIMYNGFDINVKKATVTMYSKISNKERLIFSGSDSYSSFSLYQYLDKSNFDISENNGYDEYFSKEVIDNFDTNTYFKIEVIKEDDTKIEETIKLETEKYFNNKFFYKKVAHI